MVRRDSWRQERVEAGTAGRKRVREGGKEGSREEIARFASPFPSHVPVRTYPERLDPDDPQDLDRLYPKRYT